PLVGLSAGTYWSGEGESVVFSTTGFTGADFRVRVLRTRVRFGLATGPAFRSPSPSLLPLSLPTAAASATGSVFGAFDALAAFGAAGLGSAALAAADLRVRVRLRGAFSAAASTIGSATATAASTTPAGAVSCVTGASAVSFTVP